VDFWGKPIAPAFPKESFTSTNGDIPKPSTRTIPFESTMRLPGLMSR
jgi:hypothetical protein